MRKQNFCILFMSFLLLSSCQKQDDNNPHFEAAETELASQSNTITEPVRTTAKEEFSVISTTSYITEETDSTISIEKSEIEPIFEIFPFTESLMNRVLITSGFHAFEGGWGWFSGADNVIKNLVPEEDFMNWLNNYQKISNDFRDKDVSLRTDINEFANIYSLICDFDLSEQYIREALTNWNELGEVHGYEQFGEIEKYIFSEEMINALATRNKVEVVRLFTAYEAVVKSDRFYSPGWFFYSSIEEYENAEITTEDLIKVLSDNRDFRNSFEYQYFFDVVEYKSFRYLNGDVDVIELCGYDRDFDMPMAYEGYYWSLYESYIDFFNLNRDDDNGFNVIKNETTFSPHWVYYNKPAAYIEAGITPEELIEMLPRYEALGILTDEAWAALQGKIYAYAESFE